MPTNQYIAHIKDNRIQTVADHCRTVANYSSLTSTSINLTNTCYLIGLLHDVGKFSDAFQEKILTANHDMQVDHSSAGAIWILDKFHNENSLNKITSELIALVICQHHGLIDTYTSTDSEWLNRINKSLDPTDKNQIESFLKEETKNKESIENLFKNSTQEIKSYITIINSISNHQKDTTFFLLGLLSRICLSILIDADWRDTSEFMNNKKEYRYSFPDISQYFHSSLNSLQEYKRTHYTSTDKLSLLRSELAAICTSHAQHGQGIYRCQMPTGAGKTLATSQYALTLATTPTHKIQHIYYLAPYLSILEQNSDTFRTSFNSEIFEYHSNLSISKNNQNQNQLASTFDFPFISTSFVRFLSLAFSSDKQDIRKFYQLSNSIIIIDEVQNIPLHLINLFNCLCNFLAYCCHTTIVLCSATQPKFDLTSRPIILDKDHPDMIPNPEKYDKEFKRTEIKYLGKVNDVGKLSEIIETDSSKNILVILNNKKVVRYLSEIIQKKLKKAVYTLSTDMCPQHRADTLKEIKTKIKNHEELIVISTQLIEAGVDISFDTVYRSLAGLDSIIQANGRCNREGENSELGITYIFDLLEEKLVYLPDIAIGKKVTSELLLKTDTDVDLLDSQFADRYYNQYFFNRKGEMDYRLKEGITTMFDLLSINKSAEKNYKKSEYHCFPQAFRTAGNKFEVIDAEKMGIIVPYKKSVTMIEEIKNDNSLIKKYLKKLQKYSVNVFPAWIEKNEEKLDVIEYDGCVVYCLKDEYYGEAGVV